MFFQIQISYLPIIEFNNKKKTASLKFLRLKITKIYE